MNREIAILRESVVKITQMLAGMGLEVTQIGTQAYVKTNPTTLKPYAVNIPHLPDNASADLIFAIQGFIDHEVAHILFTDWSVIGEATRLGENMRNLQNIVEDTFIERMMGKRFPGSVDNMKKLHGFFLEKITQAALDKVRGDVGAEFGVLFVPLIRALSGQERFHEFMERNGHYKHPLIKEVLDRLPDDVRDYIPLVSSSRDAMDVAKVLHDILYPSEPRMSSKSLKGDGKKSSKGGEGKSEPEKDDDAKGKGKGKPEDKSDAKPGKGKPEKDDEDVGESDDLGDGEAGEPDEDDEDDRSDEGEAGEGSDETDGDASDGEDEADGSSDDGESEGDGDGLDDDDAASGDGDGDEEGDREADGGDGSDGDEDDREEEGEGSGGGDDEGEDSSEGAAGDKGSPGEEELSPSVSEGDAEMSVEEETTGFGSVPPIDLSEADLERMISASISDAAAKATVGSPYRVYSKDFDVIEPYPERDGFKDFWMTKLDEETRHMAGIMQKDIERLVAARSHSIMTAGHRTGRLHAGSLHRLRVGDDRVFSRKQEARSKDTAVSLVIDNSGSMNGHKTVVAMASAYALSQVLDRLGIAHEAIGFTTLPTSRSYHVKGVAKPRRVFNIADAEIEAKKIGRSFSRLEPLFMPIFKGWNERLTPTTRRRFADVYGRQDFLNQNIDGECVENAGLRLLQRKEKRKIMIVLSDGAPAGYPANNVELSAHLKKVVQDLTKTGIEMVGIGICSDEVRHYYPRNFVLNKAEDLPKTVMGELKRILLS